MKFGKSTAEAEKEPTRGGGGGNQTFMKYMKDGDNYLHLADEPDKWVWFWEHYNPNGFPFPCTNDESTCPGCTSELEKMRSLSRRVAFNAFDGDYTNVWKVPKTVADKLKNRYERLGTITDRPYIITRLKSGHGDNAKWDFDLEGQEKQPLPEGVAEFLKDPEELLVAAYDEAWGTPDSGKVKAVKKDQESKAASVRSKISVVRNEPAESAFPETPQGEDPPSEPEEETTDSSGEKVVSESDLRAMKVEELLTLCNDEGFGRPPVRLKTPDQIVDWMIEQG
jgi:hypothetical protein